MLSKMVIYITPYEIFQRTIATPITTHLTYLMHDNYYLNFKWKEDSILETSCEEKNSDSLSNVTKFISVPTRILVSGDLAIFATIVGKIICLDTGVISVCYLLQNGKIVIMEKVMYGPYN